MPDAVANDYEISIPNDFYLLPVVGTAGEGNLDSTVSAFHLPEEADERLRFALASVTRVAHQNADDSRTNWAFIREPSSGRVDALLTLAFRRQDDGAIERFRAEASTEYAEQGEAELINRTVTDRQLPAGPAVIVHDFVLPRNDGGVGEPAVERSVIALFARGLDRSLEFSLVTQDLQLFEDQTEYLAQIVSQVRVAVSGEQA